MSQLFNSITGAIKRVTFQYTAEDGTTIELIKVDATEKEDHSMTSKATSHEVEDGSNISDHIIKKGRTYDCDGVISDHPITLLAAAAGNIAGLIGNITTGVRKGIVTGAVSKIGSSLISKGQGKPSKNAMDLLDYIYEQKIPIDIITGLKVYTNMVMEKFNAPRTVQSLNALRFTASFREITIVESETVEIPITATQNEGNVPKKVEGKKPTTEPGAQTALKGSTALFKLKGFIQ